MIKLLKKGKCDNIMEKITKKEQFAKVRAILVENGENDLVAFIDHEVELLTAKNSRRSNKPTKSASETAEVAETILSIIPAEGKFTASQIQAMDSTLAPVSNQRITAALKVLVNTGFVENTKEKGKSLFSKV